MPPTPDIPVAPDSLPWRWRERIAAFLALSTAILAPLPFGSQSVFWGTMWLVPLAAGLLVLDWRGLSAAEQRLIWVVLLLPVLCAAILTLQRRGDILLPHPAWNTLPTDLKAISPRAGISARPGLIDSVPTVGPLLAFLLGLGLGRHPLGHRRFLKAVYAGIAAMALVWLALHVSDPNAVLWRAKSHHMGNLTGTFLNRNMAAAFLAPGFVAALLALADHVFGQRQLSESRSRSEGPRLAVLVPALCAAIIVIALFATASRAGIALALTGSAAAVLLRLRRRLRAGGDFGRRGLIMLLIGLPLGLVAFEIVSTRFEAAQRVDAFRFEVYRITARIVADHWLTGVGPGRFADIFPSYRTAVIPVAGIWERTHNVYLQAAAEMGVFPVIVAVIAAGLAMRLLWTACGQGRSNLIGILGLVVIGMAALHGLVDYPLQIPGYSIPIALLAGLTTTASARLPRADGKPKTMPGRNG